LNSSVYRARVAFIIVSPSLIVSYGIRLAGARSVHCDLSHVIMTQMVADSDRYSQNYVEIGLFLRAWYSKCSADC
jgi:hypothetical protein